jgi:hypothetical protein
MMINISKKDLSLLNRVESVKNSLDENEKRCYDEVLYEILFEYATHENLTEWWCVVFQKSSFFCT